MPVFVWQSTGPFKHWECYPTQKSLTHSTVTEREWDLSECFSELLSIRELWWDCKSKSSVFCDKELKELCSVDLEPLSLLLPSAVLRDSKRSLRNPTWLTKAGRPSLKDKLNRWLVFFGMWYPIRHWIQYFELWFGRGLAIIITNKKLAWTVVKNLPIRWCGDQNQAISLRFTYEIGGKPIFL